MTRVDDIVPDSPIGLDLWHAILPRVLHHSLPRDWPLMTTNDRSDHSDQYLLPIFAEVGRRFVQWESFPEP